MKPHSGNWKNSEDYPPIGCSNSEWLAWEFIRRNPAYAKDFELMAPLVKTEEYTKGFMSNSEFVLDGFYCWPEAKSGETVVQFYERMRIGNIKNYRIDKPVNTFHSRWFLKMPVSPQTDYESGQLEFYASNVGILRNEEFKTKNFRLMLHPNEVAVRFRLDLPLAKQLSDAKKKLKDELQEYKKSQKLLPVNERVIHNSIANKLLTKTVFANAHYWLRCFDADQLPKTMHKKLEFWDADEAGPEAQLTQFNAEITQLNVENIGMKERKPLKIGTVKSYLTLANAYIKSKHFHLIFKVEKTSSDSKFPLQKWLSP